MKSFDRKQEILFNHTKFPVNKIPRQIWLLQRCGCVIRLYFVYYKLYFVQTENKFTSEYLFGPTGGPRYSRF
jgi:hypothetical protein